MTCKWSPLNLTIRCTESSIYWRKPTGDHRWEYAGWRVGIKTIGIISVTALNILNSKDVCGFAGGAGIGHWRTCKSPRCCVFFRFASLPGVLTLTGAGDECNLQEPKVLSSSWESQPPAVKVSIFKAHQLQWERSRWAHMPAVTVKQENFLQFRALLHYYQTRRETNAHLHSGPPFCKDIY